MDKKNYFQDPQNLKHFFRAKIKELHPDKGGDKEKYLEFVEWYQRALYKLNKKPFIKVLKNFFPEGNSCYIMETFTIKEVSLGLVKRFKLPVREKVCPFCKGIKRSLLGDRKICEKCNGKGFFELANNGEIAQLKCTFCEGKGYMFTKICPECLGKGKIKEEEILEIKLPYGLREGDILFISGEFFDSPWDFYIEVNLEPHSYFKLEGDNLIYEARIKFYEVLLEDYVLIETLEGWEKVPSEVFKRGEPVIFPRRGPYLSEDKLWERGDLIVYPKIIFPENINKKAKKLLEKFVKFLEEEGKNGV